MPAKSSSAANNVNIEALLKEIRNNFLSDLPERLDTIESLVLSLEHPEKYEDNFHELYRHIHSLKGSAGTHNLHILGSVCHKFEDHLSMIQSSSDKFNTGNISVWLSFVDLLRKSIALTGAPAEQESIQDALHKIWVSATTRFHGLIVATSQLHKNICIDAFKGKPIQFAYVDNGYDALGKLLNAKFDLLITGMEAPRLPGMALISALRLSGSVNKDIKVIMLTSKKGVTRNRQTDPDYVLEKDGNLPQNISVIAQNIFEDAN